MPRSLPPLDCRHKAGNDVGENYANGGKVQQCVAKQVVKGMAPLHLPTPVMPGLVPGIQGRALIPRIGNDQRPANEAENAALPLRLMEQLPERARTTALPRRKGISSPSGTFQGGVCNPAQAGTPTTFKFYIYNNDLIVLKIQHL